MNLLCNTTKCILSPLRMPHILCSSIGIRDTPVDLTNLLSTDLLGDVKAVERRFEGLDSQTHLQNAKQCEGKPRTEVCNGKKSLPSTFQNQRTLEKKAFEALTYWCSLHQGAVASCSEPTRPKASVMECLQGISMADTAALTWLQNCMLFLSCRENLAIMSLLCDILYQKLRLCSLRGPVTSCENEKCNRISHSAKAIQDNLTSIILALKHRIETSETLQSQPLELLLAAIYGLHRLLSPSLTTPLTSLETSVQHLLEPSDVFFNAALCQMRKTISHLPSLQTQGDDSELSVAMLLTFMLVFTPERRRDFCSQVGAKPFLDVIEILQWKIEPFLRISKDSEPTKEISAMAKNLLLSSKTSLLNCPCSNRISLQESAELMRNTSYATPSHRLSLLYYLCCCLQSPSKFDSKDIPLLPGMFDLLKGLQESEWRTITDFIISELPDLSIAMMTSLLPYTRNPSDYLKSMLLTAERIETLAPEDALRLLQVVWDLVSWKMAKNLILASLGPAERVILKKRLESPTKEPNGIDSEARLQKLCPLTPRYLALLYFLILQKVPDMRLQLEQQRDYDEALYWASVFIVSADWSEGIQTEQTQDHSGESIVVNRSPGKVRKENTSNLPSHGYHSLNALKIYLAYRDHSSLLTERFDNESAHLLYLVLDDKTVLNHYVRYLFMPIHQYSKKDVIDVLVRLLGYLQDKECKRKLMDRLIKYNGTRSAQSLVAFIEHLSEHARVLSVYNRELTDFLIKQDDLDPGRLASASPSGTDENASLGVTYTVYLARTLKYLLGSPEWRVPARAQQIRQTISSWLEHYFLTLMKKRGQGAEKQRNILPENQQQQEVQEAAKLAKECSINPLSGKSRMNSLPEHLICESHEDHSREIEDRLIGATPTIEDRASAIGKAQPCSLGSGKHSDWVGERELEEILEIVYQTGCSIPTCVLQGVGERCRLKIFGLGSSVLQRESDLKWHSSIPLTDLPLDPLKQRKGNVFGTTSFPRKGSFVNELCFVAKTARRDFVLPAHFLTLVRADSALEIPLDHSYLHYLLTSCSLEICGSVLAAFFTAVQRRRPRPALIDDLNIIVTSFEIIMTRLTRVGVIDLNDVSEATSKASWTSSGSVVLIQLMRISLTQLFRTRDYIAIFSSLVGKKPRDSDCCKRKREPKQATCAVNSNLPQEVGEGFQGNAVDDKERPCAETGVLNDELRKVEEVLMRGLSLLRDESAKDAALEVLDLLYPIFPDASACLFRRIEHQLSGFSQKELISLTSSYPPGADLVLKQMMKWDLRITVDFADFLKMVKTVPMQIVEKITQAHLDSLNFVWCTRLLSALVTQQEKVSDAFLKQILDHIMEVNVNNESDRNLLLYILQSYFPTTAHACEEDALVALGSTTMKLCSKEPEKVVHTHRKDSAASNCVEEMQESLVMIKHERSIRAELILKTLSKVLLLEEVTTTDDLLNFLTSSLPLTQGLVGAVVMEQGEKVISEYLLTNATVDASKLIRLMQFLHQYHLPTFRIAQIVKALLFDQKDFLHRMAPLSPVSGPHPSLEEPHCHASSTRPTFIAQMVEFGTLVAISRDVPREKLEEQEKDRPHYLFLKDVMGTLQGYFYEPSDQLLMLSALVDTMARYDLFSVSELDDFARALCESVLLRLNRLSSSELARFLQNISRLKKWDVINQSDLRMDSAKSMESFDVLFRTAYERADPHSRCVVVKAMCSDRNFFVKYEDYIMGFLRNDIHLLSHEDLEVLLVACLHMQNASVVEETIDAIGTRLLGVLHQCKRSTLVRLLQCHANFAIPDDPLLTRVLALLEEQFVSRGEAKLENSQLLTLLQSIAQLDLPVPTRLAMLCFAKLEKQIDKLSNHQLAQAGQLAMDLEMGYSTSIHVLVMRILESRDGCRTNRHFREVAERLCDEYDVEVPAALKTAKLRGRRERERLEQYSHRRRLQARA